MFGIQGLQLAMVSNPVRTAVLALSQASIGLLRPNSLRPRTEKSIATPATRDGQLDITTIAFMGALDRIRYCITEMPSARSLQRESDNDILEPLSAHTVGRDLNSAIYWLYLRLGMFLKMFSSRSVETDK
jgi:hypothetical protein